MLTTAKTGPGASDDRDVIQDALLAIRNLTRGLDADPARRALASAMTCYARETGAMLVEEGIETAAELRALRALRVDCGQCYLLGRPADLPAFLGSLAEPLREAS